MTNNSAKERLLELFAEGARGVAQIPELFDDAVVFTDWMYPGGRWEGRADLIGGMWEPMLRAFPEFAFPVHQTLWDGESLLVCGHFEALFAGHEYGTSGDGRRIRWEARDLYKFRDGRILKLDWANDTLTVALQVGMLDDRDPRLADERTTKSLAPSGR